MALTSTVRNTAALGTVMYQARMHAGISQRELASRLGVSKQLVWDAENGHSTKSHRSPFDTFWELGITMTATIPDRPVHPAAS